MEAAALRDLCAHVLEPAGPVRSPEGRRRLGGLGEAVARLASARRRSSGSCSGRRADDVTSGRVAGQGASACVAAKPGSDKKFTGPFTF
jgi:hypothetical protein